jgi:GntR family transcriptional regulator/MocR family aminotransferase
VGSFSKTMLPMLRVGFLVAPESLQPALRAAKQLTDWHGDPVTQAALARFIDDGLLARHARRAAREYAGRRKLILAALRRDLAEWLEPVPSAAGLHVCARLRPGAPVDLERVARRAAGHGVAVEGLARYCGEPPALHGLVIGYGAIPRERIPEGLRLLAECFRAEPGPGRRLAGAVPPSMLWAI